MRPVTQYILLPLLSPLLFFLAVANPGDILTCRMRGLTCVLIALASVIAALVVTIIGAKKKHHKDPAYTWWLMSSLILAVPAIGVILLA